MSAIPPGGTSDPFSPRVPSTPGPVGSSDLEILLAMTYDATGRASVAIEDRWVVGWIIDAIEPQAFAPIPRILGRQMAAAPMTSPIISPQWALCVSSTLVVMVPGVWRGEMPDFMTWLATNNGAQRKVQATLGLAPGIADAFKAWAVSNPSLAG